MSKSSKTTSDIATGLGCSKAYLNNKLHRNSFSLDDIIKVAYICGYSLTFTSNRPEENEHKSFQIDLGEYFKHNKWALIRLFNYDQDEKEKRRAKYETLKSELEHMKKEYGFDD